MIPGVACINGTYRGIVSASYNNGGNPSSTSRIVLLDTTNPAVSITMSPQPFSPDNGVFADDGELVEAAENYPWELPNAAARSRSTFS